MNERDLRAALEKHRKSETHGSPLRDNIRSIVYGGNDGIVTTFAVVAGTVGADLPAAIIVVLGLANLVADGLSMAAGAYLSLKSESDRYERIRKEELAEIEEHPNLEREEVRQILRKQGFEGAALDSAASVLTGDKGAWADFMMVGEHGMTRPEGVKPLREGIATFLSFIVFGTVPLLPYLLPAAGRGFLVASLSTLAAMTLLGVLRSYVTRERPLRGALEVVGIGAMAAASAYVVGVLLRGLVEGAL